MSRLKKVVEIEQGGEKASISITVHELTVQQIIDIINDDQLGSRSLSEFKEFLSRHMEKFTSMTVEQALQMAPSDLKKIYDAFREVNTTFFEVAREAGLVSLLNELKTAVVEDFSSLLVGSLKLGMAQRSLTTDIPSSLTQ